MKIDNIDDICVILVLYTDTNTIQGFRFVSQHDLRPIMSIMNYDHIGTVIEINKEFANHNNERIYKNGILANICSIEDFTYDKFNYDMISETAFNYLKTVIVNKDLSLLKVSGIEYFVLDSDLTYPLELKTHLNIIQKALLESNVVFSRYIEDIISYKIRT